jgi:hypothetical protein
MKVTDLPLLETGDLLWEESRVSVGAAYNPFAVVTPLLAAGSTLQRPRPSGLDRHPAQLGELVALSSYKVIKGEPSKSKKPSAEQLEEKQLDVAGLKLPLAGARLSDGSGMTIDRIEKSSQLIGLLRFDRGQWALQPLTLQVGSAIELAGTPPQSLKAKDDTVGVLRERASKLLRKKS